MPQYQYQILTGRDDPSRPGIVLWTLNGPIGAQEVGPNLPLVLNELGSQGWDIAAMGDVAFSPRPEIILKKTIG